MALSVLLVTDNKATHTHDVYLIDATSKSITLTLPTLLGDGSTDGTLVRVRRIDTNTTNTVTIAPAEGNTIFSNNPKAAQTLAPAPSYQALELVSLGTVFYAIGI
jgi:hypothetical protein